MRRKLFVTLLLFFLLQNFIASVIIFSILKNNSEKFINSKIDRIHEDISYDGETWDISRYNADPQILGNYPLYILTNDGFVLDRRSPIPGFLDSSDYNQLLSYVTIQTRESVTGQKRRIMSVPIKNAENENVGVVTVSYFNPRDEVIDQVDAELLDAASYISSKITVKNNEINADNLDERSVPYNISYIIVDTFNTTIKKTSNVNNIRRIPNFIDPSYVKKQLELEGVQFIKEPGTNNYFITLTRPLLKNGKTLGVIIVGENVANMIMLIVKFNIYFGFVNMIVTVILGLLILKIFNKSSYPVLVRKIWFDSKKSVIHIDDTNIEIAYATNQYYLLYALFSNPKKRWETDQLLEKFGEVGDATDARKVYDTMANINKKLQGYLKQKLIINQNKTYYLNSKLPLEKSSR